MAGISGHPDSRQVLQISVQVHLTGGEKEELRSVLVYFAELRPFYTHAQ